MKTRPFSYAVLVALTLGASAAFGEHFTRLEFIKSSGTQYIDTGVSPTAATRVVCDFCFVVTPAARVRNGWASSGSKEAFWFGTNDSLKFAASVSGDSTMTNTGVPVDTARHTFDISATTVKFDGDTFARQGKDFYAPASDKTLYLFACRAGWSPYIADKSTMAIYSCRIYEGEMLVRDFVPARRNADSAIGLYDVENGVFHENKGTGVFVAGTDIGDVVVHYQKIRYLESTGTQFIDVNIVPTNTMRVVCDFRFTEVPTSDMRNGWAASSSKDAFWFGTNDGHTRFAASVSGNSVKSSTEVSLDTNRHVFDISAATLKFGGEEFHNSGSPFPEVSSGKTMYLFAQRQGWTSGAGAGAYCKMAVYSYQVYDGETLVRDFIPARLRSNSALGFFDNANGIFYANCGSGNDFVAGPDMKTGLSIFVR